MSSYIVQGDVDIPKEEEDKTLNITVTAVNALGHGEATYVIAKSSHAYTVPHVSLCILLMTYFVLPML